MFTTRDYPALTDKLNEVFNESAALAMEGMKGTMVYDFIDTDWYTYNGVILNAVEGMRAVAEGQELPTAQSQEGDNYSATQRRLGVKVAVTKDMRMFDRYDQMTGAVKTAVKTSFNKLDQSLADLLLNGFSGTSYADVFGYTQSNVAADGVVLFSASHTNNQNSDTARNLIRNSAGTANPGISRDAIVTARKDARVYKDPVGNNLPIDLDMLLVSPTNEDLAERLIFSNGVQGTPNVDKNPLNGKVRAVEVWAKLNTSGQGTDTSAYWFMADSAQVKDTLKAIFAQKPMMQAAEQVTETQNWLYPIDAYFSLVAAWPYGVWGSTGAN